MNKQNRIATLELKLEELRRKWVKGSPSMRHIIEEDARKIKVEIVMLERIIRRQARKSIAKLPIDNTQKEL